MELLLWRWSTTVQVTSLVMIAVFFWRLGRSIRAVALQWWTRAWLANLGALSITIVFWYAEPGPHIGRMLGGVYMAAKAAFILFLIQGALALRHSGSSLASPRTFAAGLVAYAAAGAVFFPTINQIGVVQHSAIGVVLTVAGAILLFRREAGLTWLAVGFVVRGVLALSEAAAYGILLLKPAFIPASLSAWIATFAAAASTFDSGAEWFLALGCVLGVSEWIQRQLLQSNAELLGAQEDLSMYAAKRAPDSGASPTTVSARS